MQSKRHCYCRASLTARPVKRLGWLVAVVTGLLWAATPAAALTCEEDIDGVNDQPGQKDLTEFCADAGDGSPFELHTT